MLHLNSGIHLHEIKMILFIQQKLNGAGIDITRRFRRFYRRLPHLFPQLFRQRHTGRLLDQLLMIALNGAVSLPQMHHISIAVSQDLELNMARIFYKALQIHPPISETADRLFLCCPETLFKIRRIKDFPHSFSAAAQSRLDHDWIADLLCRLQGCLTVRERLFRSRHHRYAHCSHSLSGFLFIAQFFHDFRRRPHKDKTTLPAKIRKLAVF